MLKAGEIDDVAEEPPHGRAENVQNALARQAAGGGARGLEDGTGHGGFEGGRRHDGLLHATLDGRSERSAVAGHWPGEVGGPLSGLRRSPAGCPERADSSHRG